ncbi:MAG: hypothetical protein ACI9JN_001399 [Bacteroidia bacterium]|jgi:hypothetical protein
MKTLTITFALLVTMSFMGTAQITSNLVEIETSIEDGITVVTWESTKEVNTSYFIIEKSLNDSMYERISSVPAAGSSSLNATYTYEDLDTIELGVTYRITLVCMDGTQFVTTADVLEPMNIALTEND